MQRMKSELTELENLTFSKSARREDENWGYTGTDANGTAFQMTFFHAHKSQKLLVLCFKPYYNTDYK